MLDYQMPLLYEAIAVFILHKIATGENILSTYYYETWDDEGGPIFTDRQDLWTYVQPIDDAHSRVGAFDNNDFEVRSFWDWPCNGPWTEIRKVNCSVLPLRKL